MSPNRNAPVAAKATSGRLGHPRLLLVLAVAAVVHTGYSLGVASDASTTDITWSRSASAGEALNVAQSLGRAREVCVDVGIASALTCANLEEVSSVQERRASELAKAAYASRNAFSTACEQHQTRLECRRLLRVAIAARANRDTR